MTWQTPSCLSRMHHFLSSCPASAFHLARCLGRQLDAASEAHSASPSPRHFRPSQQTVFCAQRLTAAWPLASPFLGPPHSRAAAPPSGPPPGGGPPAAGVAGPVHACLRHVGRRNWRSEASRIATRITREAQLQGCSTRCAHTPREGRAVPAGLPPIAQARLACTRCAGGQEGGVAGGGRRAGWAGPAGRQARGAGLHRGGRHGRSVRGLRGRGAGHLCCHSAPPPLAPAGSRLPPVLPHSRAVPPSPRNSPCAPDPEGASQAAKGSRLSPPSQYYAWAWWHPPRTQPPLLLPSCEAGLGVILLSLSLSGQLKPTPGWLSPPSQDFGWLASLPGSLEAVLSSQSLVTVLKKAGNFTNVEEASRYFTSSSCAQRGLRKFSPYP